MSNSCSKVNNSHNTTLGCVDKQNQRLRAEDMKVRLTDDQWQKILFFLKGHKVVCKFRKFRIGDEGQYRKFIEAVC